MQIDEDVKEFLIEGYEHLNQIEGDLLVLEQSNSAPEVMNRIYRSLHTIKGNSGFLGLDKLEGVTHAAENLLSRLRDRTITLTPSITDALLQVVDAIKHHFQALETTSFRSPPAPPSPRGGAKFTIGSPPAPPCTRGGGTSKIGSCF
ncbi:Hpt domain-containing protein [Microseira wollei]|uniref:CheA signal transduction histidine kinase n=1 Tax=Microseira wollei NIES-4236 TaxID=2530354 RepID=A0AAV3XDX3_9CYAN|nr:Hpt domain-containing protein [Microseira wollei]GET40443.1 CheA signal transduction histidine kinase [Microseira wollei NIES-4236]